MEEEFISDEEQIEILEDERSTQTNKKVLKTGAKAVANYFTAGQGGKVVDIASNIRVVDNVLNKGGELLTEATKNAPLGKEVQETLNKADESGALDLADSALSGSPDLSSNVDVLSPDLSQSTETNKAKSGLPNLAIKVAKNKTLMYFLIPICIVVFIVVIMMPDNMLTLTDGDSGKSSNSSGITNNVLTNEQIENKLIYVGDSRITNLRYSINNININYIDEDAGYYWFIETGKNELSSYISADIEKFVVINFGKNDLSNIDQYINAYNILISNYNNVKFYFMSVNPVNEELAAANEYLITNAEIEEFNKKLSSAYRNNYIDVYSSIKNNFETLDGFHYIGDTHQKIHEIVLEHIKSQNNISFLGEYPSIEDSKVLQGISLIDAVGNSGITFLNDYIESKINIGGKCSGGGVAGAATALIDGLHQKGFRIPYYYGGGHSGNNGLDYNWGSNIGASIPTPKGTVYYHSGLDCSGFVAWSMNTAGVSGGTTAKNYLNYGPVITYEEASPGDLLVLDQNGNDHVILVIENKGTYLQCAESTTSGVQFSTMTKNKIASSNYKIIDTENYYRNNCSV